jgi:hypothetical protein
MTVFVFISDFKPTEENSDDDNNTDLICGVVVVLMASDYHFGVCFVLY